MEAYVALRCGFASKADRDFAARQLQEDNRVEDGDEVRERHVEAFEALEDVPCADMVAKIGQQGLYVVIPCDDFEHEDLVEQTVEALAGAGAEQIAGLHWADDVERFFVVENATMVDVPAPPEGSGSDWRQEDNALCTVLEGMLRKDR